VKTADELVRIIEAGSSFKNTFSIPVKNAEKFAKSMKLVWEKEKEIWTLHDKKTHVATYIPKTGELFSNLKEDEVIKLAK